LSDQSESGSEIHAYLAARNLLLRAAEECATEANLRRAAAANEMAENCLQPARLPYRAQALPETEAVRQRQLCEAVKVRLVELRGHGSRQYRAA
jgi:hypothetical protein